MPNKTFQTNDAVEEQSSDFNYREILDAVILHWHWFAISIIGFRRFFIFKVQGSGLFDWS